MRLAVVALALCVGAAHAAPSIDDPEARAMHLGRSAALDLGEPAPIDDALRAALAEVRTEPGELPRLQISYDGKLYDLPLRETRVEVDVAGPVAAVEVRQRYRNPFREPIETIYAFPLPENSAVTDLRFEIGERIVEAEIKPRAEARQIYTAAKAAGQTAALLEQERPNGFTQSVANIPPESEIDVVIRYVQDLTYDANTYELVFPMVIGPRYTPGQPLARPPSGSGSAPDTDRVGDASRLSPPVVGGGLRSGNDISINVRVDAGQPIVEHRAPTHRVTSAVEGDVLTVALDPAERIPNRDFVLRYTVGGEMPTATALVHRPDAGDGYFTLLVHPPTFNLDAVVGRRELVFVIDTSGSMNGMPLAMARRALELAVRQLRPTDTFNVIAFASSARVMADSPVPANTRTITDALGWIGELSAGGGTELTTAIDTALAPPVEPDRDRYVFFLTDGYVSNEAEIFARTRGYVEAMLGRGDRGRVFGLGVGSSVNRCLLNGLAAQGRGVTVYATTREDPAVAVDRFFALIDQPVLTDIAIDYGDLPVEDIAPAVLPDLFASRPLIVHGRLRADGPTAGTITLRGRLGAEPFAVPIEVDLAAAGTHPALAALWGGRDSAIVEQIVALSIAHRVMTPYTSFVAVDRSRSVGQPGQTIVQPIETPEGVDPIAAGAEVIAPPALGADMDRDGIPDAVDRCPSEPESINGVSDDDGCPDAGKVVITSSKIEILEKIYFEPGSARIRPISYAILDEVGALLARNPYITRVRVEGHTDDAGAEAANLRVSEKRARAVVDYLVTGGIDPARLEAVGYGETQPIDTNHTADGRAHNRRVEFRLLDQQGRGPAAARPSTFTRRARPAPATSPRRSNYTYARPAPAPATCQGTWITSAHPDDRAEVTVKSARDLDPLALGALLADARACYRLARLADDKLRGRLSLAIDARGRVKRTGGLQDEELLACIAESHQLRGPATAGRVTLSLAPAKPPPDK